MAARSSTVIPLETSADPKRSVHRFAWVVADLDRLNRRNKISSLPFWVPHGGVERCFQLRLVMVRGIIKGTTEADDPFALFIEYIPPPPEDTHAQHPDECNLMCTCVNTATPHRNLVYEMTARLAPPRLSCGFRNVLSAAHLLDKEFVDPDTRALRLEIAIEPHATSVADLVAKTTERVTSTLWSTAASAFSYVSSAVKQAAHAAEHSQEQQLDLDARVVEQAAPWESAPPKWRGREARWAELLTSLLPEDDNTFLLGNDRPLTVEQQLMLSQVGLSHRAIMAANSMFDYDHDVHEGLLAAESLRRRRYELVPKHVSDFEFWRNYLWRVAALSSCANAEQAQAVLTVLNAPPPAPADAPLHTAAPGAPVGGTHAACPASADSAGVLAGVTHDDIQAAVAKASESAALLVELVTDPTTVDDGSDAVLLAARRSCEAAATSLEQLRASLGAESDADAAMLSGAIEEVARALATQRTTPPAPAEDAPSTPEAADEFGDVPGIEDDAPSTPPAPQPEVNRTASVGRSASKSEDSFARMPWEEDDETE